MQLWLLLLVLLLKWETIARKANPRSRRITRLSGECRGVAVRRLLLVRILLLRRRRRLRRLLLLPLLLLVWSWLWGLLLMLLLWLLLPARSIPADPLLLRCLSLLLYQLVLVRVHLGVSWHLLLHPAYPGLRLLLMYLPRRPRPSRHLLKPLPLLITLRLHLLAADLRVNLRCRP